MPLLAFLQDGVVDSQKSLVREFLESAGYDVHTFPPDLAYVDALPLRPDVFIFAELSVMLRLVERAGLSDRLAPSYPVCLHSLLHRRFWSGTLRELENSAASQQRPLFVKVAGLKQRTQAAGFASQLVDSLDDVRCSPLVTPETCILCSEAVQWTSEWRIYVREGRILDAFLYRPQLSSLDQVRPEMLVDFDLVEQAVARIQTWEPIAGYSLDMGVLSTGETALVEINDGLALANYGIDPVSHAHLHLVRWKELMSQAREQ